MTGDSFDQSAWIARIGYTGSLEPTLGTLDGVIHAHAHAIAYESLDILLGRLPRLDTASLQQKMIYGGRGGYCFEQNMLFRAGLVSLGFDVTSLQGRVIRGLDIDAPRPALHMLLRVDLPEGPHLADVGFGNLAPTKALLLEPMTEQETPHEPMRFTVVDGQLTLQAKIKDEWAHIYRVIPHRKFDTEYEIANWYTGTHPDQPYGSNIIAALPVSNRSRVTMFNERVNLRHADGRVERRILEKDHEYRDVLRNEFGLNLSDEEIAAILEATVKRGDLGPAHPFFAETEEE